ncbi:Oidioi.mRNA.OKI2018_I69.PAR.g9963.t1.cds [Oikopleura dioica]|uniref:Oidioi.mRNA.OKI2018_I69.PAR.g9963.t1.cds n=1 Tax=Oikopleura dioica TaxID=34765 RepID=A0ABN7RSI7_OIKDI|nr:Oidioi.mRNA.OKI2018_I69.PAR.g9963.t1.cds [Oikopleura dioica]
MSLAGSIFAERQGKANDFMLDEMHRRRVEKDIADLKKLIDQHFEQRKKDEEDLEAREAQLALEKEKREAIENRRKQEEEERKKATMAAIQYATSNPKKRLQKKGGNKQEKKKVLAARRKNGNIDHLSGAQLAEKALEFFNHFSEINEDKYNLEILLEKHQYNLKLLRQRVHDLVGRQNKINTRK